MNFTPQNPPLYSTSRNTHIVSTATGTQHNRCGAWVVMVIGWTEDGIAVGYDPDFGDLKLRVFANRETEIEPGYVISTRYQSLSDDPKELDTLAREWVDA